jgi:hypothetical protein
MHLVGYLYEDKKITPLILGILSIFTYSDWFFHFWLFQFFISVHDDKDGRCHCWGPMAPII